ncbi:ligase-associated DNA damage response endonuclease PdeM [Algoriphagus lutimaris]|uniref:ligase-associated DNA damage response endonuclease PdeM n=1 Tax=Algoriphagus lutimaris TaxID=613197 RepID=UPI00293D5FD0|nr:ligase-associated DNA damage response endonuclease PdeM [Algoriphagus lutimaris]
MISQINFQKTKLILLKEKAVWVPSLNSIFIADLHFGKASHFRKSGIPIPEPIHLEDLANLQLIIKSYHPQHVYFLGDLFHSDWNGQWEVLNQFLGRFPQVQFHLVLGNHDILDSSFYTHSAFSVYKSPIELEDLILSHEPLDVIAEQKINLCGHIHPGIRLVGKARQSIRLSCFYYKPNQLILPAFGRFTGLALIKPKPTDQVFGITKEKVIPILS